MSARVVWLVPAAMLVLVAAVSLLSVGEEESLTVEALFGVAWWPTRWSAP